MKPAVSLVAVAGRRRATLDLARRLEQEGFTGIYCPSPGDGLALCEALALVTAAIPLGTSLWGVLAGVFNTIEYLGPVLVSAGLAIVGFLQFGTLSMALDIAAAALVITSVEGWWVWGPLGLILAVPMMVIVKAICDRVERLRPVAELLGDEVPR